jgi:hypothetical protein
MTSNFMPSPKQHISKVRQTDDGRLSVRAQVHGDRDEYWIFEMVKP